MVDFTSGYGNQTALLTSRLQKQGHNIGVSCFYGLEGGAIDWQGIRCYPTDASRFGCLLLGEYAKHHFGGDRSNGVVFMLQDVWPMLQGLQNYNDLRLVSWCPIDHDPAPPLVVDFLQKTGAEVVAMTRFGESRLRDAGIEPIAYIPHVVDTKVFKPEYERRAEFRNGLRIPEDAFVLGMVAANQGLPSRKSFGPVFEAFAQFQRRHEEALLYLHTDVMGRNQGVDLVALGRACGIPASALATSDQLMLHIGIPQQVVAGVLNALDTLVMPSMGEGFGIPLIEAQACGVPVITTDWTAMTELCGAGWLVEGDRWYDATQKSFQKIPRVDDILDAMEQAHKHAGDELTRKKAREFALGYDADDVFEKLWTPVFGMLERPREVAPLKLAA